jgi:hypothetical protein
MQDPTYDHSECAVEIGACVTCGTPVLAFDDPSVLPIHGDTGSPFRGTGAARHHARTERMCIVCGEQTDGATRGQIGEVTGRLCDDCAYWCDGNGTPGEQYVRDTLAADGYGLAVIPSESRTAGHRLFFMWRTDEPDETWDAGSLADIIRDFGLSGGAQ